MSKPGLKLKRPIPARQQHPKQPQTASLSSYAPTRRQYPQDSYNLSENNDDKNAKAKYHDQTGTREFGASPAQLAQMTEDDRRNSALSSKCTFWAVVCASVVTLLIVIGVVFFSTLATQSDLSTGNNVFESNYVKGKREEVIRWHVNKTKSLQPTGPKCATGYRWWNGNCEREIMEQDAIDHRWVGDERYESDPCGNFYNYACGPFIADPANRGKDAVFSHLAEAGEQKVRAVIDADADLRRFFDACVANDNDNASQSVAAAQARLGIVGSLLSMVDSITTHSDCARVMGHLARYDVLLPFELSIAMHPLNASAYVLVARSVSMDPAAFSEQAVSARMDKLLGAAENTAAVRDVALRMQFGASEHENFIDYVESGDAANDLAPLQLVRAAAGLFSIAEFAYAMGIDEKALADNQMVWAHTLGRIERFGVEFARIPAAQWKWFLMHSIAFHVLDPPAVNEKMYHTFRHVYDPLRVLPWEANPRFGMRRAPALPRGPARCYALTEAFLPSHIDARFAQQSAVKDPTIRARVASIVDHVKLQLAKGTSGATRRKIESVRVRIGGPDVYPLVEHYAIGKDAVQGAHPHVDVFGERDVARRAASPPESSATFADHIVAARAAHITHIVTLVNSMRDSTVDPRDLFDTLISTPSAFYRYQTNWMTVNAALVEPPMFHRSYDDVSAYLRLGVVLAHELVHAVDKRGRRFDENGTLANTDSDAVTPDLGSAAMCFAKAYSAHVSLHNTPCDGLRTWVENAADVEGFRAAYGALFDAEKTRWETKFDTGALLEAKRHAFLSYAQMWCTAADGETERRHSSSVHALPEFRVNRVVEQHDDFAEVWGCGTSRKKQKVRKCSLFSI